MKTKKQAIVKIGKYKGKAYIEVPYDYADWHYRNGNRKFYLEWLKESRFNKHTTFMPMRRYLETKLDGNFVYFIELGNNVGISNRLYYIVDGDGMWIKDLVTFGDGRVKQGAIDEDETTYVTITPKGHKMRGKMIVSPYYEHFPYETYKVN